MTKTAKLGVSDTDTEFGDRLLAGVGEALAYRRGEISLETRIVNAMPASRVKEIRRKTARSTKEFERRFGIPARTVEGWEQGRKVDVAGQVLLMVIDKNPEAVESALRPADQA